MSGCNKTSSPLKSEEDKIKGNWINSSPFEGSTRTVTYIFLSDKTLEYIVTYKDEAIKVNGTWNIVDNKLVFTNKEGNSATYDFHFSDNDKKLTITDSNNIRTEFTKQ